MITVKDIYENIIYLKRRNHKYSIFKLNCSSGAIEIYRAGLDWDTVQDLIKQQGFVKIPYHLFREEAARLQKYLSK